MQNVDQKTVEGFGREWAEYDQSDLDLQEREAYFDSYFAVFPWEQLPENATGFDAGCGSGRWADLVAPRVGHLHCIDASEEALKVAQTQLSKHKNCDFTLASIDAIPLEDGSMDFGYSLGVVHHIPDTQAAIASLVSKLKVGAPLLLYIYYAFDDKPAWFKAIWRASDLLRRGTAKLPWPLKLAVTRVIAALIYWPLARLARAVERSGRNPDAVPLSFYRDSSFYTMRTDALDRFGTRLEQRFTAPQIQAMMEQAGLEQVRFHDSTPFWCAVGVKRAS